jgi:hypothetical protein
LLFSHLPPSWIQRKYRDLVILRWQINEQEIFLLIENMGVSVSVMELLPAIQALVSSYPEPGASGRVAM